MSYLAWCSSYCRLGPLSKNFYYPTLIKKFSFCTYLFVKWVEKDYRLHSLSQAHFIGEDGVCALSPRKPQPVQTLQLVRVQCPSSGIYVPRLMLKLDGWLMMWESKMYCDAFCFHSLTIKHYDKHILIFSAYINDGSIRRNFPFWMVLFEFLYFFRHQGALVLT